MIAETVLGNKRKLLCLSLLRDHITSNCCCCLLAVVSIVTAFRLFLLLFIIPFFPSANDHEKRPISLMLIPIPNNKLSLKAEWVIDNGQSTTTTGTG